MTISQLKTFVTVCQSMSFTEAAKQLYISQPAVSRQISALEEELDAVLFERSHSTIQLTPAGSHMYQVLPSLLTSLESLLSQTHELGSGLTGSLSFGILLDQSMDPIFSDALQRLKLSHNISLTIHRLAMTELISQIKSGQIDFAVSIISSPEMFSDLAQYVYAEEKMCFAANREMLLKYNGKMDEDAIENFIRFHPLLAPQLGDFPKEYREALELQHQEDHLLSSHDSSYDLASIAPMVSAGLAATYVNESHMLGVDQTVVLIPSEDRKSIAKGIFWNQNSTNPLVPFFVKYIRGEA